MVRLILLHNENVVIFIDAMTTDREEEAQKVTGNVMRGTQPHAMKQAQGVSGEALHGTRPHASPYGGQAGHDKAYNAQMSAYAKANLKFDPKNSASGDKAVAQNMLKTGADPKMLAKSMAGNSQFLGNKSPEGKRLGHANQIVGAAAKRNADNQPRDPRQNQDPKLATTPARGNTALPERGNMAKDKGAEPAKSKIAAEPAPSSPKTTASNTPSAEQMAAMHHYHGRSR